MKKASFYPVLVLVSITAAMALLLSFVNAVTKGPIEEAAKEAKRQAVVKIFEGADTLEECTAPEIDGIEAIYAVYVKGEHKGYAVEIAQSGGYGGVIDLTVGVALDGSVAGVVITGHNETATVGGKIEGEGFRGSFIGLFAPVGIEDVDAISGATISCKAAVRGVNAALEAVKMMTGGNAQ